LNLRLVLGEMVNPFLFYSESASPENSVWILFSKDNFSFSPFLDASKGKGGKGGKGFICAAES